MGVTACGGIDVLPDVGLERADGGPRGRLAVSPVGFMTAVGCQVAAVDSMATLAVRLPVNGSTFFDCPGVAPDSIGMGLTRYADAMRAALGGASQMIGDWNVVSREYCYASDGHWQSDGTFYLPPGAYLYDCFVVETWTHESAPFGGWPAIPIIPGAGDGSPPTIPDSTATRHAVSLSIVALTPSVAVGQLARYAATVVYSDGSTVSSATGVSWSSSNQAIASPDDVGTFNALALGTVTITATLEGVTGTITLMVLASPPDTTCVAAGDTIRIPIRAVRQGRTDVEPGDAGFVAGLVSGCSSRRSRNGGILLQDDCEWTDLVCATSTGHCQDRRLSIQAGQRRATGPRGDRWVRAYAPSPGRGTKVVSCAQAIHFS